MVNALRIHPDDNVAVALRDLPAGTRLSFAGQDGAPEVATRDEIPFGHKIALCTIAPGEVVRKYGAGIGVMNAPVAAGEHVHEQNLRSVRGAAQ